MISPLSTGLLSRRHHRARLRCRRAPTKSSILRRRSAPSLLAAASDERAKPRMSLLKMGERIALRADLERQLSTWHFLQERPQGEVRFARKLGLRFSGLHPTG